MRYVLFIAFLLLIFVGFGAAANFLAILFVGAIILLLVASAFVAVTELLKGHISAAIGWILAAVFWKWLLGIIL